MSTGTGLRTTTDVNGETASSEDWNTGSDQGVAGAAVKRKRALDINLVNAGGLTTLIDDDGTTVYIGKALPGTATSVSEWQIKRITTSGDVTTIAWGLGVDTFVHEWDERDSIVSWS